MAVKGIRLNNTNTACRNVRMVNMFVVFRINSVEILLLEWGFLLYKAEALYSITVEKMDVFIDWTNAHISSYGVIRSDISIPNTLNMI